MLGESPPLQRIREPFDKHKLTSLLRILRLIMHRQTSGSHEVFTCPPRFPCYGHAYLSRVSLKKRLHLNDQKHSQSGPQNGQTTLHLNRNQCQSFFFPCVFHIYIIIANQIHNSYRSEAPHRAASASLITRQAPGVQRTMFSGLNLVSQSLAFRQMSLYVRIY